MGWGHSRDFRYFHVISVFMGQVILLLVDIKSFSTSLNILRYCYCNDGRLLYDCCDFNIFIDCAKQAFFSKLLFVKNKHEYLLAWIFQGFLREKNRVLKDVSAFYLRFLIKLCYHKKNCEILISGYLKWRETSRLMNWKKFKGVCTCMSAR